MSMIRDYDALKKVFYDMQHNGGKEVFFPQPLNVLLSGHKLMLKEKKIV